MPFKPGKSGNPKGRPRGTVTTATLRGKLAADLDDILQGLIEQAKAGDLAAIRLVLDRVLPPLRPREEAAPLALNHTASLADQGRAVMAAAAAGQIAPTQAANLMTALSGLARIVETDELAGRIEALEAQSDAAGGNHAR